MKKDFAHVSLSLEGYRRLSQLCVDDAFPRTYAEWTELVRAGENMAREAGLHLAPLEVDHQAFLSWCRVTGVLPCLPALRAFIIVERDAIHSELRLLAGTKGD